MRLAIPALGALLFAVPAAPQPPASPAPPGEPTAVSEPHIVLAPAEMKFVPSPPFFPPGMTQAFLSGDPTRPGLFTARARMPAGYRIPPHWHPGVEQLTVISGSMSVGMGDRFDEKTMRTLPAGGYAVMPAQMRHYVKAETDVVVEVHGVGPFAITYVNAADDPQKKPAR
jgi:quercetin dioxygenase-like cupin family protein